MHDLSAKASPGALARPRIMAFACIAALSRPDGSISG